MNYNILLPYIHVCIRIIFLVLIFTEHDLVDNIGVILSQASLCSASSLSFRSPFIIKIIEDELDLSNTRKKSFSEIRLTRGLLTSLCKKYFVINSRSTSSSPHIFLLFKNLETLFGSGTLEWISSPRHTDWLPFLDEKEYFYETMSNIQRLLIIWCMKLYWQDYDIVFLTCSRAR